MKAERRGGAGRRPGPMAGGAVALLLSCWSTGCLLTSEFALDEEPPPPKPSAAPPAPGRGVCEDDDRSCSGRQLLQCVGGRWQVAAQCAEGETCSSSLGRCATCEPLDEHRCNQGRLERCRADGTGFELLEDCAALGTLCDVELSYDRCLGCRGTDRRCGERALKRCVGGQFVDAGLCDVGDCRVVDGRNDYCPECPEPGREACGVGKRVVCSEALVLEEVESCPGGCAFDAGVTYCL